MSECDNDAYPLKNGYHYCDEGYGVGYDIVVKHCNIDKNFSAATSTKDSFYYVENWDRYRQRPGHGRRQVLWGD